MTTAKHVRAMSHFGIRNNIVSEVNWECASSGDTGFSIKAIEFYSFGDLPHNQYAPDFGYYTTRNELNLFANQEDASDTAQLLSEGSESELETFLVMKVQVLTQV